MTRRTPTLGAVLYFGFCFLLGVYFTFSAVQGNSGLFQRIQLKAETVELQKELQVMQARVAALENKTRRLSDDYLDLDLLDEQARDVLGLIGPNEIVIR